MSSIDEANTRGLIVATSYESRFGPEEREVYSCDEDTSAFEHELPIYVLSPLKGAVKRWGEDTPGLLDFVYFETEPMLQALPGQRLNFSLARKPQHDRPIKALPLPREKRERALSLVQHMRKTYEEQAKLRVPEREIPDEEYQRTLEVWDGEPLKAGLKGEATMKIPPRHGT